MSNERHALHPLMTDIQGKLGRIREELQKIRGSITKMREILEKGFEDLHDAIYDNIEAQAEIKLMERLAEVRSIPPQIEAEQERISNEKEEIEESLEGLSQRYGRKHAELNEKSTERIRNLGEHIFGILEDEFEDGIEEPFVDAVTPTWQELQEHNKEVAVERNVQLKDSFSQADKQIDEFLDRRSTLLDDIQEQRLPLGRRIDEPISLQIPFWVVTLEQDDEEKTVIVRPSYLTEDEDANWFGARVSTIEGFDDVMGRLAETSPEETRAIGWTADDLSVSTQPFASDRLGGLLSFEKELRRTIPEDVVIKIEGERSYV